VRKSYKYLLYRAYLKFRHLKAADCPTWYDGCNCFIPYDDFDNEYLKKVIEDETGGKKA
jgi:hypothetical protein